MAKDQDDRSKRNNPKPTTDLLSFKNKRKAVRIVRDLECISSIILQTKRLLSDYAAYIPAKEIMDAITSNDQLIQIHLVKFRKALDES